MPLYDFICRECGYKNEYLLTSSESPNPYCPRCETQLERQVSAPSIHSGRQSTPEIVETKVVNALTLPCSCGGTFVFPLEKGYNPVFLTKEQARERIKTPEQLGRARERTHNN